MLGVRNFLALMALSASAAIAQDVVYVTDLTIFTALAPCAASAVSYNVQAQTYDNCPEAVEDLQSCVCTKNNNFAAVSKAISSSVSYSCGPTATQDQASAATVLEAYCSQGDEFSFPEPETSVTEFITDVPGFGDLAPCAASGLAYVVQSMTYDLCPGDAANLASCVCNKNQNSLRASQGINTSVRYSCASNTADMSSAQEVFAGYCGLSNGTSSFPKASGPPGDMTYYITALSQYSDLAPCAQSAVSYEFFSQTNDLCPGGPQALASCVCLKNGMSRLVTNKITSDVKYSCGKTASEDISSAIEVFDYFCSAAQAQVTPEGIVESASETAQAGGGFTSGPTPTSTPDSGFGDLGFGDSGSGSGGSGSGSSSGSDGSNGGSNDGQSGGGSGSQSGRSSNTGVIVGAVVGVIGGLALIGLSAWLFWRQSQQAKARKAASGMASNPGFESGRPELDGAVTAAASPPRSSPRPSASKEELPLRVENISPVSANTNKPVSELHAQSPGPQMTELPLSATTAQYEGSSRPELQGQNSYSAQATYNAMTTTTSHATHRLNSQEAASQQVYEAPVQHPTQVHEMHG